MTEPVYGLHAVAALLANPRRKTEKVYVNEERQDQRLQELVSQAEEQKIPIERLSAQQMKQQFADFSHQGIVALAKSVPEYHEKDLSRLLALSKKPWLILILDGVTDPHNFGACLRSADAAGVDLVLIPKDKNAPLSASVSKVACGAAETVAVVRVTNLARAMEVLKQEGVWIYGAAGEASTSLYELDANVSLALVMGSEDKGLRHLTRQSCDGLFSLPMRGAVSSLNVSVATGICLYEVMRQRGA